MSIERPPKADFHVHYSDKNLGVVIEKASKENVIALGLISKLTIPNPSVTEAIIKKGKEIGIDVLIGVETTRSINGTHVDLIALGFDPNNTDVQRMFGIEETRQRSIMISKHQEEVVSEVGLLIEPQNEKGMEVLRNLRNGETAEKAIRYCELIVDNSANDSRLREVVGEHKDLWIYVTNKYVRGEYKDNTDRQMAKFLWLLYFRPGKKGFVPNPYGPEKIVSAVHSAGGVVLLSPEGKNGNVFDADQYDAFLEMGGDGIMAWHGGKLGVEPNTAIQTPYIPIQTVKETLERGKLVLGGSDYDPAKDDWQIGTGDGNMYISPRRLININSYLQKQNAKV